MKKRLNNLFIAIALVGVYGVMYTMGKDKGYEEGVELGTKYGVALCAAGKLEVAHGEDGSLNYLYQIPEKDSLTSYLESDEYIQD